MSSLQAPQRRYVARRAQLLVVAALAAVFVGIPAPGEASGATAACQRTFASSPGDRVIPDLGSVTSTIDVPDDGLVVADLDVSVDVHHLTAGDLELDLLSHTDRRLFRAGSVLFDGRSGEGDRDLLGTVFDDEAPTPATWASGPFTGRFMPTHPLAVYDNSTGGQYDLVVTDRSAGVSGTLNDWSVRFTYRSCDFDADGVEDHRDECRGVTARTVTGCPVTSRAVTAKFRAGKFRGALSSPVAGCKAGRAVSVFKVRRGADARVGTATTRADGSYRLGRSKRPGQYYASATRVAVPDRAECPAVKSATFRIR